MKNPFPLFWRLYLTIIAALLLVVLFFNLALLYRDQSSALGDFIADTQPLANIIKQTLADNTDWQQESDNWKKYFNFDVKVINQKKINTFKDNAELIGQVNQIEIYEREWQDGLTAAYPYQQYYIIISDLEDDSGNQLSDFHLQADARDEQRSAEENRVVWVFSVLLVLVLGVVIYRPSRQINQQVKKLVQTTTALGKGDLSIRADEQVPAPLNEIACSFNTMANNLKRHADEQQVMSHAISHELRSPLSKMQLVNSLLSKQQLPDQAHELLADSNRYIDELESLTHQILTLAKLNHQHQSDKVEINLLQLLRDRVEFFSIGSMDIRLQLPQDTVFLLADAFYLQLALDNLIKNAQKYANSFVVVTLIKQNKNIIITIEDDGPGIPADQRETVFLPFSRLDASRNRDSGGFGLGLAITAAAIHIHHGSVCVCDSNSGAKFSITIPGQ